MHLFLLIGKNPLPNYVAAKLLIEENAQVYFVYSTETKEYKTRLVNKLKEELGGKFFTPIDVHLKNPSDANCIKAAIQNQFNVTREKEIQQGASIHLNYSGGTKAMSVHVYRAIEEFGKKKDCQLKFSYLDPRKLELRFDDEKDGWKLGDPIKEQGLFEKSKIKLLDLLSLHGLEPLIKMSPNPNPEVRFEKIVSALFEDRFNSSWKAKTINGTIGNITTHAKNQSGYDPPDRTHQTAYENFIRTQKIPLPADMPEFRQALCDSNLVCGDDIVLSKLPSTQSAEEFCKLLKGCWFEDFVLSKVKAVAASSFLEDCASGLEPSLPNNDDHPYFEIDVVAMRGYQLFALSCTTLNKKGECKEKLFEVAHRAKQLGGDETRIGLVCGADAATVNLLEAELEEDHIRVFGKDNLATLDTKLKDWFDGK